MPSHQVMSYVLVKTPVERALAQGLVSTLDLMRLKVIAKLYAGGLPADMSWADLLQEAVLRMLQGSRRRPEDVSMAAFLAGVMRSIREERGRRTRREVPVPADDDLAATHPDPAPDPERSLAARQELAQIYRLFADDPGATAVLNGLGAGSSPDEIRAANGWSKSDYDSARKRMRRTLLRHNLGWRQP